jgi:hypothetical protein
MYNIGLLYRCLRWVDQRELLGVMNIKYTGVHLETNLEHTEMKISLSIRTTSSARVILDRCYGFERERAGRVEHFESEVVPVDDNCKVVPRGLKERGVK